MTFLSGLFLVALPLIAVPVAIHLYRGRQRDVIAWGAMQFLAQATTKGRRMERLEEIVLMALRVGAIGAVVLALARPMIDSSWWGATGASEVVLVLDNSLSMARKLDGFSAMDQLKENARAELNELTAGDEVHVMTASGHGQWLTLEGIDADSLGKSRIATMVENVTPTLAMADLLDCLQRAASMETESKPGLRRILVFTDNQVESWQVDAQSAWRQLGTVCREAAVPTLIEVVDCGLGETELENLAVVDLQASTTVVQPGESIDFSAQVSNLGDLASPTLSVEWFIDDQSAATTELESLEPNQSVQHGTTLRFEEPGNFAVTCRIELDDQIVLDQQGAVVVEVSDRIPILLVHDEQSGSATKTAGQLFAAALGYVDGKAQSWHSVYEPKTIASSELTDEKLNDYRSLVVTSLSELDEEVVDRLRDFVAAGGGLWVALGDRTDRESFNRDWYDDGDGLSPLAIEALEAIAEADQSAGMIHPPSREHPATVQLANTTQLDIDEARIYEHWRLAENAAESEDVSVLLESGIGTPLVVEQYLGQGRVLVQTFPLGLEWSNLPQLKSYVVVVHDWLDYLTAGSTARYNLMPGSTITATPPPGTALASAVLIAPDGHETTLVPQGSESVTTLRYSQTQLPGLYRVAFRTGGETIASLPYAVKRDGDESHLSLLDQKQRSELTDIAELYFDSDEAAAELPADLAPREEPMWGLLLVALLVLLAGELVLSNWLARQRGGVAVSTA